MRPRHCTPLGLRPAISPNVGNSGAEFLVVGVRVRAAPDIQIKEKTEGKENKWVKRHSLSHLWSSHELHMVMSKEQEKSSAEGHDFWYGPQP